LLIVHYGSGLIGLLVTRMGEVVEALESGLETATLGELVVEVYTFPGRLLHVLGLDRVVGGGNEAH